MKAFLFRFYIPVAIFGCLAVVASGFLPKFHLDWQVILTILGGILSSIYLVQKQKLEETRLFKELFAEFNHRYDQMNSTLNELLEDKSKTKFESVDINSLYDYFNLCGEEYLFYRQGYILQKAWESWVNGMKIFYKDQRIRRLWEKELKTNSYYGFKLKHLK